MVREWEMTKIRDEIRERFWTINMWTMTDCIKASGWWVRLFNTSSSRCSLCGTSGNSLMLEGVSNV